MNTAKASGVSNVNELSNAEINTLEKMVGMNKDKSKDPYKKKHTITRLNETPPKLVIFNLHEIAMFTCFHLLLS
jgi:hypothetical protein